MSEKEILEYVRKMIIANLNQYIDTQNGRFILKEIYELQDDKTNRVLLDHCKGVKELIEKAIDIIESE